MLLSCCADCSVSNLAPPPALPAGELLGAGSFGRVYRGRWNGADVAVKVIAHEAAHAEEVENEVPLLMGLQHECIVAAYHYVTYERIPESATATLSSCGSNGNASMQLHFASGRDERDQTQVRSSSGEPVRRGSASKSKAESHLVMEFCDRGTLSQAVAALRDEQKKQQAAHDNVLLPILLLLQSVAWGLQAIHSRNIVHGDLVSPRSVL
jgi:serine/threonine protein kinase